MHLPSVASILTTIARPIAEPPATHVEEALNAVAVDEHIEARADLERRDEAFVEQQREESVQLELVIKG